VRVEIGPRFWNFDCDGEINCPDKCEQQLQLSGQVDYKIQVHNTEKDCRIPIFIQLIGTQDLSVKKILSEKGFPAGKITDIDFKIKDIG